MNVVMEVKAVCELRISDCTYTYLANKSHYLHTSDGLDVRVCRDYSRDDRRHLKADTFYEREGKE